MDERAAILVVDDHEANLVVLRAVLAPLKYTVVTARSGEEALEAATAHDFVLVLMDVHMPVLDGYDTVERLRKIERARDVPIVFLTAVYNSLEHTRRGYALGAVDYVTKPFDPETLRAKVRALVALYTRGQREERARRDELDRVKDVFLAAVGHDLRSPLSAIAISARLVRKKTLDMGDPCEQDVRRIERASARMHRMIEDLFDLARGKFAGGIPVECEATDLAETCGVVLGELRAAHPDRTIELSVDGDARGEWDSGRLARLVSNLVGNAVAHARGPIGVRVVADDARVTLAVHNEGATIAPEVLPRLFEPFRRGGPNGKGLGLGLYIAREIARAHHGTIDVRSTAAEGTTFTVVLPKAACAPAPQRAT